MRILIFPIISLVVACVALAYAIHNYRKVCRDLKWLEEYAARRSVSEGARPDE